MSGSDMTAADGAVPASRPSSSSRRKERQPLFSIDARSLALFRVMLGFCLAADFIAILIDFRALYTDSGVLPRAAVLEFWPPSVMNSLYLGAGWSVVTVTLLILQGLAILAFIAGYRSRTAALLCFVFACSIQNRNLMVIQSSDDLMRVLLFWSIFVPTGARWSIDAALNERTTPPYVHSVGAFAIQAQAAAVYLVGAVIKLMSPVWREGGAVALALADGTYGSGLGRLFTDYPGVLRLVTWSVLAIEVLMPLLVWFPVRNLLFRMTTLVLLALMHVAFLVFLHVGIFPFVSLTSLVLFLPAAFWRGADLLRDEKRRAMRIYYDGECTFCLKVALIFRAFCLPDSVPIEKAQDHPEPARLLAEHNSWIVYDGQGVAYLKWEAVALVLRQSLLLWPIGRLFELDSMKPLGERLYRLIGDNRGPLGKVTHNLLPFRQDDGGNHPLREAICALLLLIAVMVNIATVPGFENWQPDWVKSFALDSRLEQRWSMFAPSPRSAVTWIVVRAVTRDGSVIDIFHGQRKPYDESPPKDGQVAYSLQKWLKYYERLVDASYAPLRLHYGRWLCRTINADAVPDKLVVNFTMRFLVERPHVPNPPPRQVQVMWEHRCF